MRSVEWHDDKVRMIDQRLLPSEFFFVEYKDCHEVAQAIRTMVIRGAPAIGAAAAFGIAVGGRGGGPEAGSVPGSPFSERQQPSRPSQTIIINVEGSLMGTSEEELAREIARLARRGEDDNG